MGDFYIEDEVSFEFDPVEEILEEIKERYSVE